MFADFPNKPLILGFEAGDDQAQPDCAHAHEKTYQDHQYQKSTKAKDRQLHDNTNNSSASLLQKIAFI